MIKLENTITPSPVEWKRIILGARNAFESYDKSDTKIRPFEIKENDYKLLMKLSKAGTDHRKYLRQIHVLVDITAPIYWWKEFDQYKVGTVTNSCSTMHTIHKKELTIDDFSHEHLTQRSKELLDDVIEMLNYYRDIFLKGGEDYISDNNVKDYEVKDKEVWWQLIQLLPSSYNQKRTTSLNYEVLSNIYHARTGHKLDEWKTVCEWIESLPYSEIITFK